MVTGNRNILNSIKGITSVVKLTAEEKTTLADRVLPANILIINTDGALYVADGVTAIEDLKPLAVDGETVHQTGDETIAGTKTFSAAIVGSVTGNAGSATKLATARKINGTDFDGTANITTANWGTARNISITDGTNTSTAVSVNGSANVSLNLPSTIEATFVGNVTGNVTGNCSGTAGSVAWGNVSGKPSTFTPSSHTHDDRYYTESEINTLLLSKVYPVGAIYISVNSVNPGTLFGGTWEKIKDRFLLASGDTYSIGSTGGNSSTTLGIANLPSHNHTGTTGNESQGHTHSGTTGNQSADHTHSFSGTTSSNGSHNHNAGHGWHNVAAGSDRHCLSNSYIGEDGWSGNVTSTNSSHAHNFSGTTGGISANHNHSFTTGGISAHHTHSFTTSSVGSTEAFSNMPPYLTVNIWKRTA